MALVVTGTVVPMAPDAELETFAGSVWLGDDGLVAAVTRAGDAEPAGFACGTAPRRGRRTGAARPGRPPLPPRVQHAAAVGRAVAADAVPPPRHLAGRGDLRARRRLAGVDPDRPGAGVRLRLRPGQGGHRRHHLHPGMAVGQPAAHEPAGAQRGRRSGGAAPRSGDGVGAHARAERPPPAQRVVPGRVDLRLPLRRGASRHPRRRGVHRAGAERLPPTVHGGDPRQRARRLALRALEGRGQAQAGRDRRHRRVVALLEPLALRHHDVGPRRPGGAASA